MALKARLQRKSTFLSVLRQILVAFEVVGGCRIDTPDPGVVVCAAGGKVSHIGRKKDPCNVSIMCCERRYGLDSGYVAGLDHAPDIDIPLERASTSA